MKDKYIEHEFPRYFVFGEHSDGRVEIATAHDATVATVSQEHAEKLISDRSALVQKLCDMARAFDEAAPNAFHRFWYGGQKPAITQPRPMEAPQRDLCRHRCGNGRAVG